MIRVMMNIKIYVENHEKKIIITFILTGLKGEIKEDIVIIMKAKTVILNVLRKQNLSENYNYAFTFTFFKCCMQLKIEKI